MLIIVLGWATVGLGVLGAAPATFRLVAGRYPAGQSEDAARSKAWSDIRKSAVALTGGLSLVGNQELGHHGRWWLVSLIVGVCALVWITVSGRLDADSEPEPEEPPEPSGPELPLPGLGASGQQMADWVERKRFSTTRLRPGYDEEEVDVLLDKIRDTFLGTRAIPVTRHEVNHAHFARTHLRPGYVEEEVNAFLENVRVRLA